ncbi:UNVERIFIED_CONTAM: hypothetical protein GTU68_014071, partial [Idotea baltica]|nr:hypothetical protein [Idotea baltica]
MAGVSAQLVKELREKSGAGMMDCKKALEETNGDIEQAIQALRKKGLKSAEKRAGKVAAEGLVYTYIHPGSQVGVLVEINCETDFVARGDEFATLAKEVSMHIAWSKPQFVSREEVSQKLIDAEIDVAKSQLKPEQEKFADKIIQGKLDKFYGTICLEEQLDMQDSSGKKTIKARVDEIGIALGEKVSIRRFVRFEVGE